MGEENKASRAWINIFIFPSFKTTHTTLLVFWETQGAGFYDKHGTTLHLFVMLFPAIHGETFRTRNFLIKISEVGVPEGAFIDDM